MQAIKKSLCTDRGCPLFAEGLNNWYWTAPDIKRRKIFSCVLTISHFQAASIYKILNHEVGRSRPLLLLNSCAVTKFDSLKSFFFPLVFLRDLFSKQLSYCTLQIHSINIFLHDYENFAFFKFTIAEISMLWNLFKFLFCGKKNWNSSLVIRTLVNERLDTE